MRRKDRKSIGTGGKKHSGVSIVVCAVAILEKVAAAASPSTTSPTETESLYESCLDTDMQPDSKAPRGLRWDDVSQAQRQQVTRLAKRHVIHQNGPRIVEPGRESKAVQIAADGGCLITGGLR